MIFVAQYLGKASCCLPSLTSSSVTLIRYALEGTITSLTTQETLQGLVHSFILHRFLTNTSHPTRVLLRRMTLFYHMGLIEDEIPKSGMLSTS